MFDVVPEAGQGQSGSDAAADLARAPPFSPQTGGSPWMNDIGRAAAKVIGSTSQSAAVAFITGVVNDRLMDRYMGHLLAGVFLLCVYWMTPAEHRAKVLCSMGGHVADGARGLVVGVCGLGEGLWTGPSKLIATLRARRSRSHAHKLEDADATLAGLNATAGAAALPPPPARRSGLRSRRSLLIDAALLPTSVTQLERMTCAQLRGLLEDYGLEPQASGARPLKRDLVRQCASALRLTADR